MNYLTYRDVGRQVIVHRHLVSAGHRRYLCATPPDNDCIIAPHIGGDYFRISHAIVRFVSQAYPTPAMRNFLFLKRIV